MPLGLPSNGKTMKQFLKTNCAIIPESGHEVRELREPLKGYWNIGGFEISESDKKIWLVNA